MEPVEGADALIYNNEMAQVRKKLTQRRKDAKTQRFSQTRQNRGLWLIRDGCHQVKGHLSLVLGSYSFYTVMCGSCTHPMTNP
jgi:hypothetical protein